MTFTKLFSSITESTIWIESSNIRLVWITMLAMADSKGRVWASVPGLANRARVPVEDVEEALDKFLGPDKYSRTPDNEGRRIEKIDGGWRLLNHAKYRQIRDEEAVKESKRAYITERRKREKTSTVEQCRTPSNSVAKSRCNAEAEAEAETELIHAPATPPPNERDLLTSEPPADPAKPTKPKPAPAARPADVTEVEAYCVELNLPKSDGQAIFDKWTGSGWKNGGQPIKDWKATIRAWKAQGYMPSQRRGSGYGQPPASPNRRPASCL